jgi:hypothetical protein
MRLSRVSTTQPFAPARESQLLSSAPLGKCCVRRSTTAPAVESASAIESLSSDSSRKTFSRSGGLELAADGVPDGFFVGTVFFREHGHAVARLELLGEHGGRDAGAGDRRTAE